MQLQELQVEGFRGINQPLSIPLNEQMVIISGINGSGKTSIFQAIEWGLFGRLDFSGTEFQREDAIVNDFHPGEEARVTLTLDDGTVITRTRKKKSRTGFGKRDSKLSVTHLDKQMEGDEAQAFISDMLSLNVDEFGAVAHLRQATIRSFIEGAPGERSQTIDKMIGLFYLRELISGLDPSEVDKEVDKLEQRVEDIERTMIQATILNREMVKEQEELLEKSGILREHISNSGALAAQNDLSERLKKLSEALGVDEQFLESLSERTFREATALAKKNTRDLGEQRFKFYSSAERRISELTQLQNNLSRSLEAMEATADIDIKSLVSKLDKAKEDKGELEERLSSFSTFSSNTNQIQQRVAIIEVSRQKTKKRLQDLGTIMEAETKLEKILKDIEAVAVAGLSARALDALLPTAVEYLQTSQPDQCPVCKKGIDDLDLVIQRLQNEVVTSKEATTVQDLERQRRELTNLKQKLSHQIEDINSANEELSSLEKNREIIIEDLKNMSKSSPTEPLTDFIEQQLSYAKTKIESTTQEISNAGVAIITLEEQIQGLEGKQKQLKSVREEIATKLGLPVDIDDLETPLRKQIEKSRLELKNLEGLADSFPAIDDVIDRIEQILGVLEIREKLAQLEREYPTAMQEKEAINRAIDELSALKLGLQDIYLAATEHQRSVVGGALSTLEPVINERYSRIMGHPEYSEIQIEPEEEKKGVYRYWIVARNAVGSHSTYVSTRFSTAQRNVAAVAIFLAMSEHLPHNLNVLMMDDPTQSMDPERQMAMAQFLAEECSRKQVVVATEDPNFTKLLLEHASGALHYRLEPWTATGTSLS